MFNESASGTLFAAFSSGGCFAKPGWENDFRSSQCADGIEQDNNVVRRVERLCEAFVSQAVPVGNSQRNGPRHFSANRQNRPKEVIERNHRIDRLPEVIAE
ncbi:MAG: hypothetical protein HQL37_05910 [Alphaproteobacteria bacterium]|nr:hypothetical protein [Alphaproteobacteria bacterium]